MKAILAILATSMACAPACGERVRIDPDARGAALTPMSGASLDVMERPGLLQALAQVDEAAGGDPAEAQGLYWSFEPRQLRVMRATEVRFRVDALPAGHEGASCLWRFGDRASAQGCEVSHSFPDGDRDRPVSLEIVDGDFSLLSRRVVPLERLPVTAPASPATQADEGLVPAPPRPAPTNFRMALIADSANDTDRAGSAVAALLERVSPSLLVHVGGIVLDGGGDAAWDAARDGIAKPAGAVNVPLAWAMSPTDSAEGARVRRPSLSLVEGADYPRRYSFTFKGAFFVVLAGASEGEVSDDDLAWMRRQLTQAQVHDGRYVISYLPLHRFSEDGPGGLNRKFEVYELLLRARVTALFSAGHRVYFKGRYGALAVVSVGPLVGPGGKLVDSDFRQPTSYVVVDVQQGLPERIFAVAGPDFVRPLDEQYLPELVEVYTQ